MLIRGISLCVTSVVPRSVIVEGYVVDSSASVVVKCDAVVELSANSVDTAVLDVIDEVDESASVGAVSEIIKMEFTIIQV